MILWPLPGSPQLSWHPSTLFRAVRPWGGTQTRWHAGLDLKAGKGTPILAPEDLVVVDVDRGWDGTAKATLVHTASGRSLLLGCTMPGSAPPEGTEIPAGGQVARVGNYTRIKDGVPVESSMLHLQVYDAKISPAEANKWQSWSVDGPRPPHLIDPRDYLTGAEPVAPQAGEGGELTPAVPCPLVDGLPVCLVSHAELWASRLSAAVDAAVAAYTAAGWPDAPELPSGIRAAVDGLNASADTLDAYRFGEMPGSPADQVRQLVEALVVAEASGRAFAPAGTSGGGSGAAIAVGVTFVVLGGVTLYALGGRRRR